MRRQKARRHIAGFTLLELLVVLVILALLGGLVGPRIMNYLGGAKTKTAGLQINDLSTALEMYRLEVGRYPTSDEGLQALVQAPGNASNWNGPYLNKSTVPKDPWGNDYQYRAPGQHGEFDLYSLGADNSDGGEGENKDVVSWE